MLKNTSGQKVGATMVSAVDGSAFTGTVTVYVTGDAGTQAIGSVGSGVCTHEGQSYHTYAPAQAETNYDLIAFTFTGSGAVPVTVQVYTVAGDPFTRLGAPAGASVSADVAAIKAETASILTDTAEIGAAGAGLTEAGGTGDHLTALATAAALATVDGIVDDILVDTGTTLQAEIDGVQADTEDIQARLPAALVSGRIDASVGAMAANVMTAAAAAADLTTELQSGLATAAALATVDGIVDDILLDTAEIGAAGAGLTEAGGTGDHLTAVPWNASWDAQVESEVADALEATIADSVPADGTRPSVKQALYMLTQFMLERSVSSTTVTIRKVDGSTSLFTLSLNDATSPTSITRAS